MDGALNTMEAFGRKEEVEEELPVSDVNLRKNSVAFYESLHEQATNFLCGSSLV